MGNKILVVDDQAGFCNHICAILESEGYEVYSANTASDAMDIFLSQSFDILLTDIKMPDVNGRELFTMARKVDPNISGIVMTAYGTVSSAVECIKEGMTDYIEKPFEPERLVIAIERTLKERRLVEEIRNLREEIDEKYSFENIVGKNHKMLKIYDLIKKVAPTDTRILITGETGVGKELVAKAIHFNSQRRHKPFVAINCGSLAETLLESELFGHEKGSFTGADRTKKGKFEYARGGTLFFDEVGDISAAMQIKLLRVLQENRFERVGGNASIETDVRILSASNQDLSERIKSHEFRMDLYYRLNVVHIHIPPLRERLEDIPLLVKRFILSCNDRFGRHITEVSPRAMTKLIEHSWPGNVRELENVIERAFVTADGDIIDSVVLSRPFGVDVSTASAPIVDNDIPFSTARSMLLARFERKYVAEALRKCQGNVSETSRRTGINSRTLWRKIKQYGLERSGFEPDENVSSDGSIHPSV